MTYSESVNQILEKVSKEPEVVDAIKYWDMNQTALGYGNAESFSKVVGSAVAKHLQTSDEQLNPEEIAQVYRQISDLVIKYCDDVAKSISEKANIGFVPAVKANVEKDVGDMLKNLVDKMHSADDFEDVKFLTNENSARSITRKSTTSHMKYTARGQQRAGVKVLISRTGGSKCCDFCASLTGTFTRLEDLPENFWSVHRNCTCSFHYNVGKTNETISFASKEDGSISKETVSNAEISNKILNKEGNAVVFNWGDKLTGSKTTKDAEALIQTLLGEYNSFLTSVSLGAEKAAGVVGIGGNMRLNAINPSVILHEFAHSLAMSDRVKYNLADKAEISFLKELTKIRTQYENAVYGNPKKGIEGNYSLSISAYSHSKKDEFMAEAFAHAKMREMGIEIPFQYGNDFTYSQKVLDLVNKYFSKS